MSDPSQHELPTVWLDRIPDLTGPCELEIAGLPNRIEMTREELTHAYLPLLCMLVGSVEAKSGAEHGGASLGHATRTKTSRVVAGLAGIPGGGKSTFAAVLASVADRLISPGWLAVVPMDGWHWPNAVLDSRTILDEEGRSVPLRTRKGGPDSFDTDALTAALRRLRTTSRLCLLPAYDRRLHEPVADAIGIGPETRAMVVEGNYVLGGIAGAPAWDEVGELVSPRVYLACDPELARERIVARHIRGGASAESAAEKYAGNDGKNAAAVLASAGRADLTVSLCPPGVCRQHQR